MLLTFTSPLKVAIGVCLLCSTACTMTRPIAKGATQHNKAIHDSTNRTLLLNILRAADREPKTFTSVSGITGKGSASPGPSFSIGLSSDASDKLSLPFPLNGPTSAFSVKVHDSKEFAQGLFDPVSTEQLLHFWNQGWSRTMLLLLAVSSVEVSTSEPCERLRAMGLSSLEEIPAPQSPGGAGCKAKYWNRPGPGLEEVRLFAQAIATLVRQDRVSIEPAEVFSVVVTAATPSELDKLASLASKPGYSLSGLKSDNGDSVNGKFVLAYEVPTVFLALGPDKSNRVAFGGSSDGSDGTWSISGTIRSTESLLHYIGQIHRYQGAGSPLRIPDPQPAMTEDPTRCKDRAFFEIAHKRFDRDSTLVSVKHRGKLYSIVVAPRSETCAPMTGTVLSFLRQAFSLNSSDSDAPAAGLVLVGVDG